MIVVQILKIIGITLIIIIALVLLLLLLLLFWPYFYVINLSNEDKFKGNIIFTWFFKAVTLDFVYQDTLNVILKVLGITFYDRNKKKNQEVSDSNPSFISRLLNKFKRKNNDFEEFDNEFLFDTKEKIEDNQIDTNVLADIDENSSDDETNVSGNMVDDKSDPISADEYSEDTNNESNFDKSKDKTKKKTKLEQIKHKIYVFLKKVFKYLSDIPSEIVKLKDNIAQKINGILETIEYYQKLAEKPGTKKVLRFLKKEIIILCKHLKPYKSKININYVSDDPQSYAKVIEFYALLYPYLPKRTNVNSTYGDENDFKFNLMIKGRFYLFFVGYHVLIVLLNKKVKRFISLVKREE